MSEESPPPLWHWQAPADATDTMRMERWMDGWMDGGERRRRSPQGLCSAILFFYRIIPHPVHWGEIINLLRWATAFPVVAANSQANLAPLFGCTTSSLCVIMVYNRLYDTDTAILQGSAEYGWSFSALLLILYSYAHAISLSPTGKLCWNNSQISTII